MAAMVAMVVVGRAMAAVGRVAAARVAAAGVVAVGVLVLVCALLPRYLR
jgi:hypothetical protein